MSLFDGRAPNRVAIGDTDFLFTAHFKKIWFRSGGDDGRKLVLADYFNLPNRRSHRTAPSCWPTWSRASRGPRPVRLIANW
jgi:hypothetical protein